jgi:competence protein ComEA
MWLFVQQYRKLLALCAIPIIAAAAFFGYRLVHAQSNQNEAYTVNNQMQSLLEEVDGSSPTPTPSEEIISESTVPKTSSKPNTAIVKASSKPKPTVKPTQTPEPKATTEPKATAKPKASSSPKPAQTPKAAAKPRENAKPQPSQNPNFKINLNIATLAELMTLPQIGEIKAKAIIAYREQVKQFKTIEEIVEVKGIGPQIFEKIKGHLEL